MATMNFNRQAEPELMDLPEEAEAYARADFSAVNQAFVERVLELAGERVAAIVVDLGTGPGIFDSACIREKRIGRSRPSMARGHAATGEDGDRSG